MAIGSTEANTTRMCTHPLFNSSTTPIHFELFDFVVTQLSAANNHCSCSQIVFDNNLQMYGCDWQFDMNDFLEYPFLLLFSLIVVAAVVGNATVIWIILAHAKMRTVTNYFLLNLAVADASISILNVIPSSVMNINFEWWLGSTYCHINSLMGVAPTTASATTLMLMSYERYQAICHPLRRRLSHKMTILAIAAIWVYAVVSGLPNFYNTTFGYYHVYRRNATEYDVHQLCYVSQSMPLYDSTLLVIQYVLPSCVLSYTYARITKALWFSDNIGAHRNVEQLNAKKKVVKMLSAVVAVFLLGWLPYQMYFAFSAQITRIFSAHQEAIHVMFVSFYWIAMSTPVWPPVIYYNMNTRFNIGFHYVFRWLPCCSKFNVASYEMSDLFDARKRRMSRPTSMMRGTTSRGTTLLMSADTVVTGRSKTLLQKTPTVHATQVSSHDWTPSEGGEGVVQALSISSDYTSTRANVGELKRQSTIALAPPSYIARINVLRRLRRKRSPSKRRFTDSASTSESVIKLASNGNANGKPMNSNWEMHCRPASTSQPATSPLIGRTLSESCANWPMVDDDDAPLETSIYEKYVAI